MQDAHNSAYFSITSEDFFDVKKSSFTRLSDSPERVYGGVIIICISGSATVSIDLEKYHLKKNSQLILLPPQSVIMLNEKSDDFVVVYFSCSKQILDKACFLVDSHLFAFVKENKLFECPIEISTTNQSILGLLHLTCMDKNNEYREIIATNYLQNYLLNTFDKISKILKNRGDKKEGRKLEIFKRFVHLVHQNYLSIREVNFYANELLISPRYLSNITQGIDNSTPKNFIDNCVIQEIKIQLRSSNKSIQEIADYLNFPDQSYLSRFFKKETGLSPSLYREKR